MTQNQKSRSEQKSRLDIIGDRQKLYELNFTASHLMPGLPVMARLDGRAFHTFTRGLARPYCEPLSRLMVDTAKYLVEQTHCAVAYTQSDEITLAWRPAAGESEMMFNGRVQKLVSVLAAVATGFFNKNLASRLPQKAHLCPAFDARVWQLPNLELAAENFYWREADATKNAVTMAASAYYSHRELHKVGSAAKHDMLMAKGVNFNDYPAFFKRGTYVQRRAMMRELSAQELARIPEGRRPEGPVLRSVIQELDLPPFAKLSNPVEVLFEAASPDMNSPTPQLAAA